VWLVNESRTKTYYPLTALAIPLTHKTHKTLVRAALTDGVHVRRHFTLREMRVRRTSSLDRQRGFYPFFGVNRPFDPEFKFVTARFLSPKVFGLLRLLIAIYGLTTVIVDIVLTGIHTDPLNLSRTVG
jgi:hypothetical protein